MKKKMVCISCPIGCLLEAEIENGKVINLTGNKCEKGLAYATQEIESPSRILTSSVQAIGLQLKMLPVRTSQPIPKTKIFEAMEEIKKITVKKPIKVGEILVKNFMSLGIDIIATREANLNA
ncbi:MAG: DUF1667 domain-containing protein [Candidatus Margulisiibacteriota bacterium]